VATGTRWRAASPLIAASITLLLWASAFIVIRDVGSRLSPSALGAGRLIVAALALGPLVLRQGWVRPTRNEWLLLVLGGVGWFGIYNIALNAGERRVDAGTAALLVQVGPIIVALVATVVFKEPFTGWLALGILVGFAGVALIASGNSGSTRQDLDGVLLVLVAALMYAVGVMSQKPVLGRLPGMQVVWISFVVGALTCLPGAGDLPRSLTHGDVVTAILYLGLFPTAIGFTTWAYALRHSNVGALSLTTFLVPFLATLIAWMTLNQVPPVTSFIGGSLAIVGVLLTRRKPRALSPAVEDPQKQPGSPSTPLSRDATPIPSE
jgi:drug/metabolite transporter (DMT)-like permease